MQLAIFGRIAATMIQRGRQTALTLIITWEKTNISRQNAAFQAFCPQIPPLMRSMTPRWAVASRAAFSTTGDCDSDYFSRLTLMFL
jgi:hypothetical protein